MKMIKIRGVLYRENNLHWLEFPIQQNVPYTWSLSLKYKYNYSNIDHVRVV